MPNNSDEYKNQVMKDLAKGNKEILPEESENYQNFDDFAQRSSREERRNLFGDLFQKDRITSAEMEPELQKAIASIKPNERDDVAKEFFSHLKKRGLNERDLEQQLSLSTHDPNRMKSDDVAKLAGFAYHSHPDIFHEVLADQPALVKFLSNPLVGAALGAIAAKWFGRK
jgi:DNA-directed RNA polymerase subunit F